ncbi:MAG: glycosyltransferase [Bacteroidaceae bacterium]|nr:glycosyltransferase [Bacteroidaceae bacterium]
MKLSIIIPVYKVEQYIEKCLVSCLEQDIPHTDYEIIVVNDGSPDKSLQIAEDIASKVVNMCIISQPNGGLSVARNAGLKVAKGEYVWFIDSDDWIEKNCLAALIAQMDGTDVIHIGHCLSYSSHTIVCIPKEIAQGESIIKRGFLRPAPFYIMRLEFLKSNDLNFKEGIYHEDTEFTPRMLYLCKSLKVHQHSVYYYLQRENSITSTVNPKRGFDLLIVAESLYKFRNDVVSIEYHKYFNKLIASCINASLNVISKSSREKKKQWTCEIKKRKHLFKAMLGCNKLKYKLQGAAFLATPARCIISVYKLMTITK